MELARSYAEKLRSELGPLTAIVYGSVARGDFNLGSDVDVLIIAERMPPHPLARMEILYSPCLEPPLEPKGYTPAEFRDLLSKGHPAVLEAYEQGVAVADDLGLARSKEDERVKRGGR